MTGAHRPPHDCPVCGQALLLTRLGCEACGTELSGSFHTCDFCALGEADRDLLRVFLTSRGNMRELERHLGVSYPTARVRYDQLLARLGLERGPDAGGASSRLDTLRALAGGEIDVDEAAHRLGREPQGR